MNAWGNLHQRTRKRLKGKGQGSGERIRSTLPSHPASTTMSEPEPSPYDTRLNILYRSGEVIDVPALVSANTHPWYNQTLCAVNESVVRLGVLEGEYHWHHHEREDEFFFVVSGRFLIDLEDSTVELMSGQGFVVAKGLRHRPRAPEKTVVLMVETASIVPTGS
jgi:mannose-6-phosphate isomerase-like protein (cupin superfamily)